MTSKTSEKKSLAKKAGLVTLSGAILATGLSSGLSAANANQNTANNGSDVATIAPADAPRTGGTVRESTDRIIVELEDSSDSLKQEVLEESNQKVNEETSINNSSAELVKDKVAEDTSSIVIGLDAEISKAEQERLAQSLEELPGVKEVYPDKIVENAAAAQNNYSGLKDVQSGQWGIRNISTPAAWSQGITGKGTVIAVVDTGSTAHSDLSGQELQGYDFVHAYYSGDGNGRDSNPADVAANTGLHGQFVAGITSAKANGTGIVGVAPDSKFFHARALGNNTNGYVSDIADSVTWSAGGTVAGAPKNANPASVINMSMSWISSCDPSIQRAINFANSKNIPVIVAAGNASVPASSATPANCAGAVSVGATTYSGTLASFSNYGSGVDLVAPGNHLVSTYGSGFKYNSGTSFAAPHVAGLVALMKEAYPSVTKDEAFSILSSTSDKTSQGYKKVNANKAVAEAKKRQDAKAAADYKANGYPVVNGILDRYNREGGAKVFGKALNAEYKTANGAIRQDFENNRSIIWHAETGAHTVFKAGAIGGRWIEAKEVAGYGVPIASENTAGGGARQFFKNTSTKAATAIYWSEATGAKVLNQNGAIHDKYLKSGGFTTLGYPSTDELKFWEGSKTHFKNSSTGAATAIYWSEPTGAHTMNEKGAIFAKWAVEGDAGKFGFPVTDEVAEPKGGASVTFQKGSGKTAFYWSEKTGVQSLNANGALYWHWKNNGYIEKFGYPTSSEQFNKSTGRVELSFQNGVTLAWTEAEGVKEVKQAAILKK